MMDDARCAAMAFVHHHKRQVCRSQTRFPRIFYFVLFVSFPKSSNVLLAEV